MDLIGIIALLVINYLISLCIIFVKSEFGTQPTKRQMVVQIIPLIGILSLIYYSIVAIISVIYSSFQELVDIWKKAE